MKVIADLCVVPVGVGVSVSAHIAACQRVLQEAGLTIQLHAYGTNIEGEWDSVFAASKGNRDNKKNPKEITIPFVKRCHEVVHEMGAPRISTSLKIGTRTDRAQTMADKVSSVVRKLAEPTG